VAEQRLSRTSTTLNQENFLLFISHKYSNSFVNIEHWKVLLLYSLHRVNAHFWYKHGVFVLRGVRQRILKQNLAQILNTTSIKLLLHEKSRRIHLAQIFLMLSQLVLDFSKQLTLNIEMKLNL